MKINLLITFSRYIDSFNNIREIEYDMGANKGIDVVSVALIILGGFVLQQGNNFGWFFVALGLRFSVNS